MANKNGASKTGEDYPWRESNGDIDIKNFEKKETIFSNIQKKEHSIWEVYNSEVKEAEDLYKFCNDRAYIVLTVPEAKDPKLQTCIKNLHIWVSKHCSKSDYQLAIVLAEQLAKLLDDTPFLHREIQLHETDAFHNHDYVLEIIRSDEDSVRLLQFHVEETAHRVNERKGPTEGSSKRLQKKWMVQRKLLRGNLCSEDVFVLTNTDQFEIFQWNGQKCKPEEKKAAADFIKVEQEKFRNKAKNAIEKNVVTITVNEGGNDKNHRMYTLFPVTATKKKKARKPSLVFHETKSKGEQRKVTKQLYRLTDESGHFMDRALEDLRTVSKSSLKSKFVYLLDTDYHVYVWIGEDWVCQDGGDRGRLNLILEAADRFLVATYAGEGEDRFHQPANKPLTLVNEDDHCIAFDRALLH